MKNLYSYFKEKAEHPTTVKEQKITLRKHLLLEREEACKYADPQNWGPRQFFRSLEILKIKNINDLKDKYLVACFFPIRHELNLNSFAQSNWLFPRIGQNKELLWFEYGDGKTNYGINEYGIKEKELPYCFPYTKDFLPLLCFVPGIAAAQNGSRLGYGGGYYDKFLNEFKEKVTSVMCLPSQEFLFNALPCDENDALVDLIVF